MNLNHVCTRRKGRLSPNWVSFDFLPDGASVKRGPRRTGQPMTKSNLNAGGINAHVWSLPTLVNERKLRLPVPAPSVRLPATRENRARLRELRAAELQAWKVTSPNAALRVTTHNALAVQRGESRLFGVVAVIAACGLMIGVAAALDFVTHWTQFVSLVRTLLG
jgi:hypothetical protein